MPVGPCHGLLFVLLLVPLSGCLGGSGPAADAAGSLEPEPPVPAWTQPVRVNPDGWGYEPSVRTGPGFVVVAAARGFEPRPDGSLASPVWRSGDDGTTWVPLESPAGVRDRLQAQEGDLGVDADGTVYFVDTDGADAYVTVWDRDGAWIRTTPLGSLGVDDRPWVAAHGTGVVYLLSNSVASVPLPESTDAGAVGVYRSGDGGLTWSLGWSLSGSYRCGVAASPLDDVSVAVVCLRTGSPGVGIAPGDVAVFWSTDGGVSWSEQSLAQAGAAAPGFPSVGFTDAGRVVAAWGEQAAEGGLVRIASAPGVDGPWRVEDVAWPEPIGNVWTCAGGHGAWGVTFAARGASGWRMHAGLARSGGDLEAVAVQEGLVSDGSSPPADFHQCAVDAEGRMHVAYHHDPTPNLLPLMPPRGEVRWVRSD